MTQGKLCEYIFERYGVEPEHPFPRDDVSCVFRHADNRKWFALTMRIPYRTLGVAQDGQTDMLNVKCDPIMTGSMLQKSGFYPAYHMNKRHWITILLDGSAEREDVEAALEFSFDLTKARVSKRKEK